MFQPKTNRAIIGLVVSFLASSALASPGIEALRDEADSRRAAAEPAIMAAFPEIEFLESAGRITTVSGTAFGSGATPEAAADQFRQQYAGLFGVTADQLAPRSFLSDERHAQPLMPDRVNGGFKFTLVYYRQEAGGVPIFRSELRILVRNQPGSPVVMAHSSLRNIGAFAVNRAAPRRADLARAAAIADTATLARFTEPKLMIWAGVEDLHVEPRLALVFYGESGPETNPNGYDAALYVTDAATGSILYRESAVHHVDVTGQVTGLATELPKAGECNNEIDQPMPYAAVNIQGQGTFYADVNGNYTITNGGASDVTVESGVAGRRFIVADQAASTPTLSQVVTPPGPANFQHNSANTDEFLRASVNSYVEANRVRDMVVTANPAYPTIGTQINMGVNTNINTTCNAFYSPASQTINFYRSGGGCFNSGFGDVVHHEYGHHVVQMAGSGQGQYGEGTGDCMGVLMSDQPILGFGFQTNCNAGIRTASNTLQYPCSGTIHSCGQLISGCVWDTRQLMIQTEPLNYRTILADLVVNAVITHVLSTIEPDITQTYLTLDDDDANLANGTPHCFEINTAFKKHNMGSASVPSFTWAYPGGRPAIVPPNATSTVDVNASGGCPTPVAGTGTISYRIGTGGGFTTVPMAVLGVNQYQGSLPAAACLQTIQYYFTVNTPSVATISDPIDAPSSVYSTVSSSGIASAADYNFQVNPGWTVSGTVLDGPWDANPGVPVNCSRGDPVADFDGSGNCWMTDNSAAASCNSDVDDGTTTLTSQTFDLSTFANPVVSYARWYSNTFGNNPQTKTLVIETSTNGGGSWTNLETVGPTTGSPHPEVNGGWFLVSYPVPNSAQFRIRFTASDGAGVAGGSVVEAAIDAFSIKEFLCPPPCPAATGDMNIDTLVNGDDVQTFVDALFGTPSQPQVCAGDFNVSTSLDAGDVDGFVLALLVP